MCMCLSLRAGSAPEPADVIVIHGRVYTVDSKHPWAEAIAIRAEKIVAVGSDQEIARHRTPATNVIDAKGSLVLPGFTDCHVHFMDGSISLGQVELDDRKTLTEVLERVK